MKIHRYILPLALLCASLLFLYQTISKQQQQNSIENFPVGTVDLRFDLAKSIEIKKETDIQRFVKEPILRCIEDSSLGATIAKRVCTSEIKSFWGVKALIVAFFISDAGLTSIKIDIPNEKHDEATKLLISRYGPATEFKGLGPLQRSMSWNVPGGIILFPPYASLNKNRWSSIVWLTESMIKKPKSTPNK